jgi:hypothetical protein
VATRRWILFLQAAAMTALLAGCGSNTFNVQNPPPPPPSNVCVAFPGSQCPPVSPVTYSVLVNGTLSLSATVTHDPSNAGVDWSLTCSSAGNCGTLSSLHTDSGSPLTYTAPASLAGNNQMVNVVAFATADHTKNALATAAVTAFGNNLKGTYVLQAQGAGNGAPNYQFAGVINLDGNGGVVPIAAGQPAGEQTINFFDATLGAFVSKSEPITGGSYFLGPDGRGTITLSTGDNDIGGNGVETFTLVYLNSSQALIVQGDFGTAATGVTASGTMDLQTSTATPTGSYAFVVSGSDLNSGTPTAIGGILNLDSLSTGTGSVADQDLPGVPLSTTTNKKLTGSLSTPDAFGAVVLNLNVPLFPSTTAFTFIGYIVDGSHIKLIETDNSAGAGIGSTAGLAISQGTAAGTFSTASFQGTYVFGVLGVDLSNGNIIPATSNSVGLFTPDGSGAVTSGFSDTFLQQNTLQPPNFAGAQISAAFVGTYTVAKNGRVGVSFTHFKPQPNPRFSATRSFFYLTGDGSGPALVLAAGDNAVVPNYPFLGAGIAYPQSTSLTFGGDYGVSVTQNSFGSESDGTGWMTADATAQTLSGIADLSAPFFVTLDSPFFGTPPTSTNCLAGTPITGCFAELLGNGSAGSPGGSSPFISLNQPFPADFYTIDQDHGFFVETDLADPVTPSGVVSLGYYARRSLPVPPATNAVRPGRR